MGRNRTFAGPIAVRAEIGDHIYFVGGAHNNLRVTFQFHAQGADSVTAARKALGAVYGMVQQHAAMLASVEAFWMMGVVFLLMIPLLPLLQYVRRVPAAEPTPSVEQATLPPRMPDAWPEVVEPAAPVEAEEEHLVPHG